MTIRKLTPEQEALIPVVRDEWLAHGLSTQPADRGAAEEGVRAAYREAGLEPPRVMLWLRSPLEGCVAAAMLAAEARSGAQVREVGAQVRYQFWGQVKEQVSQVEAQDQQVGDQVWGEVQWQVWDQVLGQVRGQIWDQIWDQGWDEAQVTLLGQHDATFMAWADFWLRAGVVTTGEGLLAVARSAGWWWAFSDVAILTERPIALHQDAAGRLHNPDGLAIEYSDGWGACALHGVRVPACKLEQEGCL